MHVDVRDNVMYMKRYYGITLQQNTSHRPAVGMKSNSSSSIKLLLFTVAHQRKHPACPCRAVELQREGLQVLLIWGRLGHCSQPTVEVCLERSSGIGKCPRMRAAWSELDS